MKEDEAPINSIVGEEESRDHSDASKSVSASISSRSNNQRQGSNSIEEIKEE